MVQLPSYVVAALYVLSCRLFRALGHGPEAGIVWRDRLECPVPVAPTELAEARAHLEASTAHASVKLSGTKAHSEASAADASPELSEAGAQHHLTERVAPKRKTLCKRCGRCECIEHLHFALVTLARTPCSISTSC